MVKLQKVDFEVEGGKEFAFSNSKEFIATYFSYLSRNLNLLVKQIQPRKCKIRLADYGGGNGILEELLIKKLLKKEGSFVIDLIDVDKKKFRSMNKVKLVYGNALLYKKPLFYDYSVSRFLLHYFNSSEQKKFLRNVSSNLKEGGYFLLIDYFFTNKNDFQRKMTVFCEISKIKGVMVKNIPKEKETISNAKKAGLKLIEKKQNIYYHTLNDFYKNRFQLSKKELQSLKQKLGNHKYKEKKISLLFQKEN